MKGARKRGRKELLANWPGEKKLFQTQRSKNMKWKTCKKNFLTKIVSKDVCTLMPLWVWTPWSLLRVVRQEAFEPAPQCGWCNCSGGNVCLFVYCWRVASGAGQMSAAALLLWAAVSREVKQKFSSFLSCAAAVAAERERSRLTRARAAAEGGFLFRILLMRVSARKNAKAVSLGGGGGSFLFKFITRRPFLQRWSAVENFAWRRRWVGDVDENFIKCTRRCFGTYSNLHAPRGLWRRKTPVEKGAVPRCWNFASLTFDIWVWTKQRWSINHKVNMILFVFYLLLAFDDDIFTNKR